MREIRRVRPPPNARGGVYHVKSDFELEAKVATLIRKIGEMEGKGQQEVKAI